MILRKPSPTSLAPEGTHQAQISVIAELGIQATNYGEKSQIAIGYWLPGVSSTTDQERLVIERYTLSLYEKSNLYPVITAACGTVPDEIELKTLLGRPVEVDIVHRPSGDGRTWANVQTVRAVSAHQEALPPPPNLLYFDLEDFDQETFVQLPRTIRGWIEKSQSSQAASPVAMPKRRSRVETVIGSASGTGNTDILF